MSGRWFAAGCVLLALGFGALGVWQLDRRAWKLDLIQRVNARVAAPPDEMPPTREWGNVNTRDYEYRRVRVRGVLMNGRTAFVQAVTALGPGWWVMTPLQTDTDVVLINRGFVPDEVKASGRLASAAPSRAITVTGLIRMPEPHGGFLRANDLGADRWYSRDVAAIAKSRKLGRVAPFFIDADATPNPGGYPIGGLTVIAFRNAHLVYALTWFGLAGLCLFGAFRFAQSNR